MFRFVGKKAVKRTFPAPLTLKFGKNKMMVAPAQFNKAVTPKIKILEIPYTVDATNQGEEKNPFPTSPTDLFLTVHVPLLIRLVFS